MPDETKADEPKPTPPAPKAPAAPPRPLGVGDRVTLKAGNPLKAEGDDEPVGRVTVLEPMRKILYDDKGVGRVDGDGNLMTEDDGYRLNVIWPTLRTESKHRPEELARWEPEAKS